jgi:phosphoribosyl-ATP pyrophosphohydrolase/phosphoribosyl-AMP cyclohydrolase/histidinol dehydrogenase
MKTFQDRIKNPQPTSYTNKLLSNETMLKAKILEEAKEVIEAKTKEEVIHETADLFYFTLVNAAKHGVTLHDIDVELNLRTRQVNRRQGVAKSEFLNVVNATEPPKAETPKPAVVHQQEINDYSTVTIRRLSPEEVLGSTCDPIDPKALTIARDILTDVKNRGLPALIEHAQRLGDIASPNESVFMTREELKQHFDSLPKEHQETLLRTAERIRSFAQSQRDCLTDLTTTVEVSVNFSFACHIQKFIAGRTCWSPSARCR